MYLLVFYSQEYLWDGMVWVNSSGDRVIMAVDAASWKILPNASEYDDARILLVMHIGIWENLVFMKKKMSYLLFFLTDRRKMINYSLTF